jgi:hypothetical protein
MPAPNFFDVELPMPAPSARVEEFFVGEIDVAEAPRPHLNTSHSSNALLASSRDAHDGPQMMVPQADGDEMILGTSAPAELHAPNWAAFPSIPEHSELQMAAGPGGASPAGGFAPPDAADAPEYMPYAGADRLAGIERAVLEAEALDAEEDAAARRVPRVASMPNLTLGGGFSGMSMHQVALRRSAAAAAAAAGGAAPRAGFPRSRSANDVTGLDRYTSVPHSEFLTPPHLRKGKGGRQPAGNPLLDPRIDPKKAKRILANRLSAAKSKLKQKSQAEGMRQRVEMLRLQREGLATEVTTLEAACAAKEAEREALLRQLRAAEETMMRGGQVAAPAAIGMHFSGGAVPQGLTV